MTNETEPEWWDRPPVAQSVDLSDADFKRDLGMARDYIGYALGALADEHEGNFRHFVTQAHGLLAKVKSEAEAM